MSAVAARRARQQQAQAATAAKTQVIVEIPAEPPSKRPRRSLEGQEVTRNDGESQGPRTRSSTKQEVSSPAATRVGRQKKAPKPDQIESQPSEVVENNEDSDVDKIKPHRAEDAEMVADEVASVIGDADGYESPADTPAELQNFPLSKARLNKGNVIYADEDTMCVRIKEKTVWQHCPLSNVSWHNAYFTLEFGVIRAI